jgi:pimeloyl-ACP methyl ester carboxylesterase
MERIVFVHGSVIGGRGSWGGQRPLGDRFELVILERPGFPPNPPVARVDFESDAALVAGLLQHRDHLVGHSYGAVIALLAAAQRADGLGSLTVIEPPAIRVAAGDPEVDAFADAGRELYALAATTEPEVFLQRFLEAVGSPLDLPSPLPPDLEQGAQALLVERGPWEAAIPLDDLAAAAFPKLVVSGAHLRAFDVICDGLERELEAERVVLPGYGHVAQRHPDFNATLADFVERASSTTR